MRVVAPYTILHPATEAWLDEHAPMAERVLCDDGNVYWDLLCELWRSGDDFALIEHDMEPPADALAHFGACDASWCLNPYEGGPISGAEHRNRVFRCALGCTRFRGSLTVQHPDLIEGLANTRTKIFGTYVNTIWNRLDSQIASLLFQAGHRPCEHEPMAVHHHDYTAAPVMVG